MYFLMQFITGELGQRSWYSDLLWAGKSGDQIQVGTKFSAPVQTGSGAHPTSCTTGTMSFAGVRQPGLGVDLSSSSRIEVKERVELYIYSSVFHGLFWDEIYYIYYRIYYFTSCMDHFCWLVPSTWQFTNVAGVI